MTTLDPFDRMLNELPRIAEAVNAFSSEDVQKAAFAAVVAALNIPVGGANSETNTAPTESGTRDDHGATGSENTDSNTKGGLGKPARATRARKSNGTVHAPKDIDFWPKGKESLPDFVATKLPAGQDEQNLVAVYYLEQVLELADVSPGHVLAAYKACKWPEPSDIGAALRKTASRKHWIDTHDSKSIKTMPGGRNMLEHTMPVEKATKPS